MQPFRTHCENVLCAHHLTEYTQTQPYLVKKRILGMIPKPTTYIPPSIIAGQSIGLLKLGADKDALIRIMGVEGLVSSYENEHKVFADYGYVPEDYMQFQLGFDAVHIFNEPDHPKYPIFKAYLKVGVVSFMIITSYGTDVFDFTKCALIKTENDIAFGDNAADLSLAYGETPVKHHYGEYIEHIYPTHGISFLLENDQIRVIRLFPPQPQARIEPLTQLYNEISERNRKKKETEERIGDEV